MKKQNSASPKTSKTNKISILTQGILLIQQHLLQKQQSNNKQNIEIQFQENEVQYKISSLRCKTLKQLYPQVTLKTIYNEFQNQYVTLPPQILGKRSSKIVMSKSRNLCLKIIEQDDLSMIQEMFDDLTKHIKQPWKSCLASIYAIFVLSHQVKGVKILDRYIIIPNLRSKFDFCIKGFDIKGHLDARQINQQDCQDFKFGKDANFINSKELALIKEKLSMNQLQEILQNIKKSVMFLGQKKIIDYSLLISLEDGTQQQNTQVLCCYKYFDQKKYLLKWALIDYFQQYNSKKKMQNKLKSLFRKSISSVQPQVYSSRMISFLEKYLCNKQINVQLKDLVIQ